MNSVRSKLLAVERVPFSSEWDFLRRACITKDEASGQLRPFPADLEHDGERRFAYLEYLTETRKQHPIFAVEKSRRMMITWWLLCLYLYDTLTQRNHANYVGSRKMESSAYLLGEERILGVYKRIPRDVWPDKPELIPSGKLGMGYSTLSCPATGSYIQAIASGADQLRQYTASNVLMDEFAFWERARESWTSIKPTIDGGGHVDMVSTPELGAYMYDLLYDEEQR